MERLSDRELLTIHRSVVNLHSLAYVVESRLGHRVYVDLLNIEAPDLHCHYSCFNNRYVLMYLGDLNGDELNEALRIARNAGVYYVNVLVAPHHGNAVVYHVHSSHTSQGVTSMLTLIGERT